MNLPFAYPYQLFAVDESKFIIHLFIFLPALHSLEEGGDFIVCVPYMGSPFLPAFTTVVVKVFKNVTFFKSQLAPLHDPWFFLIFRGYLRKPALLLDIIALDQHSTLADLKLDNIFSLYLEAIGSMITDGVISILAAANPEAQVLLDYSEALAIHKYILARIPVIAGDANVQYSRLDDELIDTAMPYDVKRFDLDFVREHCPQLFRPLRIEGAFRACLARYSKYFVETTYEFVCRRYKRDFAIPISDTDLAELLGVATEKFDKQFLMMLSFHLKMYGSTNLSLDLTRLNFFDKGLKMSSRIFLTKSVILAYHTYLLSLLQTPGKKITSTI